MSTAGELTAPDERGHAVAIVKQATEHDWRQLRLVRLSALADSPSAFASSLDEEERFTEADWREWARSSRVFIAVADSAPVGVVGAFRGDSPEERTLVALWVHPDHRGGGVASALVSHVEDWGRQDGAERLTLWVAQGNEPATSLYESHGFEWSGKRKRLPSSPEVEEQQMLLTLR